MLNSTLAEGLQGRLNLNAIAAGSCVWTILRKKMVMETCRLSVAYLFVDLGRNYVVFKDSDL